MQEVAVSGRIGHGRNERVNRAQCSHPCSGRLPSTRMMSSGCSHRRWTCRWLLATNKGRIAPRFVAVPGMTKHPLGRRWTRGRSEVWRSEPNCFEVGVRRVVLRGGWCPDRTRRGESWGVSWGDHWKVTAASAGILVYIYVAGAARNCWGSEILGFCG